MSELQNKRLSKKEIREKYCPCFKAGQESHINNKILADILYTNGFKKALEEVDKKAFKISIAGEIIVRKGDIMIYKKDWEALKKKEVKP